jgi:proteasome lid subunit RPN8/RPN11
MLHLELVHIEEISRHGELDYPYECCGLLIGRFTDDSTRTVVETYPISNAREEQAKRNRFLIRPEELLSGERYAESRGFEVVGFYHSHPDHPATPSQYDLEHAWPTFSYVVVSISEGSSVDLRSWQMEPDRSKFNEEVIVRTNELSPKGN